MDTNQYEEILRQIEKSDYDLKLKGVSAAVLDKIDEYGDDFSNAFSFEDVTQIAKELLQTNKVWSEFNKHTEDHIVKKCEDYDYEMRLNYGEAHMPSSVRETLEAKRAQRDDLSGLPNHLPVRKSESMLASELKTDFFKRQNQTETVEKGKS